MLYSRLVPVGLRMTQLQCSSVVARLGWRLGLNCASLRNGDMMSDSMNPGPDETPGSAGFQNRAMGVPPVTNPATGQPAEAGPPQPVAPTPEHHELLRLCQHCSTQTVTDSQTCPVCGSSYVHEPWLTRTRLIAVAAVVALLLVVGGGVALVRARQAQMAEEQRIAAEQAAAAEVARQEAAEQAAREKKAQAAADAAEAERLLRASNVAGIEKSVTKMAREHASDGVIEGWPKSTTCSPVAGQSIDNLSKTTTKFSCFVTTERLGGGRARGHYYQALMNWETGRYTYGYAH